jgi:hypothetical protein
VQEVAALAEHYQRPPATPAQAAEIMRLPTYPAPYSAHS